MQLGSIIADGAMAFLTFSMLFFERRSRANEPSAIDHPETLSQKSETRERIRKKVDMAILISAILFSIGLGFQVLEAIRQSSVASENTRIIIVSYCHRRLI